MKTKNQPFFFASLTLGLVLVLVLVLTRVHAAGLITVTTPTDTDVPDGECSLREAIIAANSDMAYNGCVAGSGTDNIIFDDNYTITLSSALPPITSSMTIEGNSPANTIIQATACNPVTLPGGCTPADWRVFTVLNTTATLKDMTIRHGACETGGGCTVDEVLGGNIYMAAANLILDGVHVQSGYAYSDGGGIYNDGGNLTIQNNSLVGGESANNLAFNGSGGGIYLSNSTLLVDNSRIAYNHAYAYGGGIEMSDGSMTIQNGSFIDHNSNDPANGDYGGGIDAFGLGTTCNLTIDASTIADNSSGDLAGGIWTNCIPTNITNSTISGNTAVNSGGGIFAFINTPLIIANSTVYNNSTNANGGGLIISGGMLTITNSTFSGNSADLNGGGIYTQGNLELRNSILANSPSGADCYNSSGDTIAVNVNNLIENNGPPGNMCGVPDFTADPMLGPLADNGGQTLTLALLVGSPAIDRGDNATCAAPPINNLDQRGVNRPYGDICDIGAFEWQAATIYLPIVLKSN